MGKKGTFLDRTRLQLLWLPSFLQEFMVNFLMEVERLLDKLWLEGFDRSPWFEATRGMMSAVQDADILPQGFAGVLGLGLLLSL